MANYRVSTNTNSNKTTNDKTTTKETTKQKAFYTQTRLTKISVDLQTAFAAETHLAEGQWLKRQPNVLKLRMFRVGTRMSTVSRTYGHCSVPLKYLLIC
jgi:hypothetical protein